MSDNRVSEQFHKDCKDGTVQDLILNREYTMADLMRRYRVSRSCVARARLKYDLPTPDGFYRKSLPRTGDEVVQSDARKLAMSGSW